MANHSSGSLPAQTCSMPALKAAYRLLANRDVTHSALSTPHWEAVRHQARAPGLGPVLFIQDATELDFSHHPCTSGLGFIGDGRGRGMELQTTLCVLPGQAPELLGMAYSVVWTRAPEPRKVKEKAKDRKARHKETDVWGDSVEAIGKAPEAASGTRWISVSDRGSDVFSFLERATALGWKCLVRSKHDRRVQDDQENQNRLHQLARSLDPTYSFELSLRARPGKSARTVSLQLAWSPLTLLPPMYTVGDPIPAWIVRVWEESSEDDALEWILVSTDEISCLADALQKVEWYKNRWIIEEYHKCLKTGCNMEKRQVSSKQSLQALLGFLGVVSVYLLQLKSASQPIALPDKLKAALKELSKQKLEDSPPREILREIAKLGGFLGRKGDGEPGWQTIWKGWNRLQDIALGMQLANEVGLT